MLVSYYRIVLYSLGVFAILALVLEGAGIISSGFSFLDVAVVSIALLLGWRLAQEQSLNLWERAAIVSPIVYYANHLSSTFGNSFLISAISIFLTLLAAGGVFIALGKIPTKKFNGKPSNSEEGLYPIYLDDHHVITTSQVSEHVQVVGKSGSGKSASYFLNAKWQSIHQGKGSFNFDAKSEELDKLAYYVQNAGREKDFIPFDLRFPDRSFRINPLAWFKTDPSGKVVPDSDIAANIAKVSVYLGNDSKDDYYPNQGKEFLGNFTRLFLREYPIITYNDYYQLVAVEIESLDSLRALCEKHPDTSEAQYFKGNLLAMEAKERRKILSGLLSLLSPFVTGTWAPLMNTTEPDILLSDIIQKNKIFHLGAASLLYPAEYKKISVAFLMGLMGEAGRRSDDANRIPFDLFLDEFASIAYPGFVDIVEKIRSKGIGCHLGHQSLGDLEAAGGEPFKKAIIDNTTTKIIFRVSSVETADYMAKMLGTKEAELYYVRSFKTNSGLLGVHQEAGQTEKGVGERDFIVSPDEMKNFGKGEAAVALTYKKGIERFKMQFAPAPLPPTNFDFSEVVPLFNHHLDPLGKTLPIKRSIFIPKQPMKSNTATVDITPKPHTEKKDIFSVAKKMREETASQRKSLKVKSVDSKTSEINQSEK